MHENILQFQRNIQPPSYVPYSYSNLKELQPRTTSNIEPNYSRAQTNTLEKENQHEVLPSVSPILPGTGNVMHNVTHMLEDSVQTLRSPLPGTSQHAARYSPYSTAHFMSFRQKILHENSITWDQDPSQGESLSDTSISNEISISSNSSSAVTPPLRAAECSPMSDTPSNVNISSLGEASSSSSSSPRAVSNTSSHSPNTQNTDRVESPKDNDEQPKKKTRTNFTNEQVQALIKIFHETPYPDSAMMENIGKDLGITEKQVKIWFQNKRARWRRRINDKNNNHQSFLPVSPMLSPVAPYGFMPTGHMVTSSPIQNLPGYSHYPWTQGTLISSNNHQGQSPPSFQMTNQNTASYNNTAPFSGTMSSAQYGRSLPQQNVMSNQNRYLFQYPSYMRS